MYTNSSADNVSCTDDTIDLKLKVLATLDRAIIPNILVVMLESIGIFGSLIALVVLIRDPSLHTNHYIFVRHLLVGTVLSSYSFLGRTAVQLYETGARNPLLFSKLLCICVFFKLGSPVWRYMHLVIQIDRIVALWRPLNYQTLPDYYPHVISGVVWLLAAFEQSWALFEGIVFNVPHLTACTGRLMYSSVQIDFETNRDLTIALMNILAALTIVFLFHYRLRKVNKMSAEPIAEAQQSSQSKILKASATNASCFALTIFLGATLRAAILNKLSSDDVPLFGAYIAPLYSALEASIVFMYYSLNTTFRHALNRCFFRKAENKSELFMVGNAQQPK